MFSFLSPKITSHAINLAQKAKANLSGFSFNLSGFSLSYLYNECAGLSGMEETPIVLILLFNQNRLQANPVTIKLYMPCAATVTSLLTHVHQDTRMTFRAALLIMAKTMRWPKGPSTGGWVNKLRCRILSVQVFFMQFVLHEKSKWQRQNQVKFSKNALKDTYWYICGKNKGRTTYWLTQSWTVGTSWENVQRGTWAFKRTNVLLLKQG